MRRRKRIRLEDIADWGNLELALVKVLRGKRERLSSHGFIADLPESLADVGQRIRSGTPCLNRFYEFTIHDPKERLICAPCFEDRVTHHAVMNLCEPEFERWQIEDSYACRRGKGLHAAVKRASGFADRYRYFLKGDIKHYFETIPRKRLLERLLNHFPGEDMAVVWSRVISSWRECEQRGLPIGSLTSQHLGNYYLGYMDRLIKQDWKVKGYVRYMDDFVLWSDSKKELVEKAKLLDIYLKDELDLVAKPWIWGGTNRSMSFLGTRIRSGGRVGLGKRSRKRYAEKIRDLTKRRDLNEDELQQRLTSLTAFTEISNCKKFRKLLFSSRSVTMWQ